MCVLFQSEQLISVKLIPNWQNIKKDSLSSQYIYLKLQNVEKHISAFLREMYNDACLPTVVRLLTTTNSDSFRKIRKHERKKMPNSDKTNHFSLKIYQTLVSGQILIHILKKYFKIFSNNCYFSYFKWFQIKIDSMKTIFRENITFDRLSEPLCSDKMK